MGFKDLIQKAKENVKASIEEYQAGKRSGFNTETLRKQGLEQNTAFYKGAYASELAREKRTAYEKQKIKMAKAEGTKRAKTGMFGFTANLPKTQSPASYDEQAEKFFGKKREMRYF